MAGLVPAINAVPRVERSKFSNQFGTFQRFGRLQGRRKANQRLLRRDHVIAGTSPAMTMRPLWFVQPNPCRQGSFALRPEAIAHGPHRWREGSVAFIAASPVATAGLCAVRTLSLSGEGKGEPGAI